jgi:hypothetical protein
MNTHRLHRTVAAALAACTSLVLFTAVVSIAPAHERGELLARAAVPSAQPAPAMAQAPVPAAATPAALLALSAE